MDGERGLGKKGKRKGPAAPGDRPRSGHSAAEPLLLELALDGRKRDLDAAVLGASLLGGIAGDGLGLAVAAHVETVAGDAGLGQVVPDGFGTPLGEARSEEHTSELQSRP